MKFKRGLFLFFIPIFFLFFFTSSLMAATTNDDLGFIKNNIWYSEDPFSEGDEIQIYTFVFNPNSKKFKGQISFFDGQILLGKKDFLVESMSAQAVSTNWKVTVGSHNIYARIDNPQIQNSSGVYEKIDVSNNETDTSNRIVAKKLPSANDVKNKINEAIDSSKQPLVNLENKINASTPSYITQAFQSVDVLRDSAAKAVLNEKNIVKKEINVQKAKQTSKSKMNNDPTDIDNLENKSIKSNTDKISTQVQTPIKYVELFFLALLAWVLKYPIVFYTLIAILVSILIRFIARRLF